MHAPVDVLWERVRERDLEQRSGSRAIERDDLVVWAVFKVPGADELALFDPPSSRSKT